MMSKLLKRRDDTLRDTWDDRVTGWHEHVVETEAFDHIRDELVLAAAPRSGDRAVDLGAGTGFVTLPLARQVASVIAVDISSAMLHALADNAEREGLEVQTQAADLSTFDLADGSVDLVVSNYALHHLTDRDKEALVRRVRRWLRPGGRFVIADMMFGRGMSSRDRAIARQKAAALLRKGPGGLWRVAKNTVRFGMRIGMEQPASPETWSDMLRTAGFGDVRHRQLPAEASLIVARR
jgi:ubiquinone/menaquinone biosynthesis C-methylase UbiE